ncbi:hypothetical protein [Dyella sp.]|uniref:hypothetical protein n=1 Tax=Dyella sp. TaxID=1869338 RepID=UPI002FDB0891
MTKDEAEQLSIALMQIVGILDQSIMFVRDKDDEANGLQYRRAAGKVMAGIFMNLEEPLWERFPELRPRRMGGPYRVSPEIYEPLFYERYGDVEENDE